MPFELWGATGTLELVFPDRPLGYLLLLLYGLPLAYTIFHYREGFRRLTQRQWALTLGLWLASFLLSQLFPINFFFDNQLAPLSVAQNPVTTLTLFAAASFLLAGAILNPAVALVAGLFSGLGRALGQSHQIFDVFHLGFAAVLAAGWLQQNYAGHLYRWLRQPIVAGALSMVSVTFLVGLSTFATAPTGASNLAALDLALSTANANFLPLLIEGAFGGGLVTLILLGAPQLRAHAALIPSPEQRSLSKRLLTSFLRYAILLIMLLVSLVFTVSINVSTRLVTNQMAHNASTVSAEIPDFQADLQNLLMQYSQDETLLSDNTAENETVLRQLFRTGPLYRRILLVSRDEEITAFYPTDIDAVRLTDLEQTVVASALATSAPGVTSAQTREDEHVLSFVVPVQGQNGRPEAVLVGRVPELSLRNLITGLQGTVGEGSGFIVDENGRIIAHPDSSRLLSYWQPPSATQPGVAYQGRQGQTNARELVYYVRGSNHPWTVVIKVPYEIVLNLALNIALPLTLVLLLVTAAFYANLVSLGRDITQPITELVQATKTIAAGPMAPPPSLPLERDDEVGQLGQAFVQMHRSLKNRLDELSLLLSVSHDVSTSMDINHSMPAILQGALRGTGAAGARAVVFNPSGGHPLTFGEGPAAEAMAVYDRQVMQKLRSSKEIMLSTPGQIRAELGPTDSGQLPVPALIAIALHSHDRFQGILWLGYRQPHSFNLEERNLLQTLAGQASVLVENARLFATAEGGRRRLAAVLASTSDAVIVTDQTERILLINRAMERIFQLKAHEVIGRPVTDVIHVEPLIQVLTSKDERMRTQEIPTNDGKVFYTSASTIISNDGQTLGRVAVLHDITHFKEIDEMKTDFVATVSHDLRSPLTFMRGYATMLPMVGELNEKQREYTEKILNGIDQMSNMVNDLLDLARLETGMGFVFTNVEVKPLLMDIANEYWQHAHLNGIKLQVDVNPGIYCIRGDQALIRQAVTNLINNGIKYAPKSGAMTLRAEQHNGEVVISVQDHGPGISKQDQMRLFEKFYRVKQRGTEKVKGSGLGLSIVRTIAERHGGRAWVSSQVGQGSTFYISLPMGETEKLEG